VNEPRVDPPSSAPGWNTAGKQWAEGPARRKGRSSVVCRMLPARAAVNRRIKMLPRRQVPRGAPGAPPVQLQRGTNKIVTSAARYCRGMPGTRCFLSARYCCCWRSALPAARLRLPASYRRRDGWRVGQRRVLYGITRSARKKKPAAAESYQPVCPRWRTEYVPAENSIREETVSELRVV